MGSFPETYYDPRKLCNYYLTMISAVLFCRSCEIKEESLQILHEAGLPMLLGFLIHVCLHFLFVQTRFGFIKVSHKNQETSPLLTSRSEFKDDQLYSEHRDTVM